MNASDPFASALDAIAERVARRVLDELRPHLAAHATPTASRPRLTLDELAHEEACSRATVRRLISDGAPVHYLGASPRFDLEEWRAWCAARGRQATRAKPSQATIVGMRLLSRGGR